MVRRQPRIRERPALALRNHYITHLNRKQANLMGSSIKTISTVVLPLALLGGIALGCAPANASTTQAAAASTHGSTTRSSGSSYEPGDVVDVTLDPHISLTNNAASTSITVPEGLKLVGLNAPASQSHEISASGRSANLDYEAIPIPLNPKINLKVEVENDAAPGANYAVSLHTIGVKMTSTIFVAPVPTGYTGDDSKNINIALPPATEQVDAPKFASPGTDYVATIRALHLPSYRTEQIVVTLSEAKLNEAATAAALPKGFSISQITDGRTGQQITLSIDPMFGGQPDMTVPLTVSDRIAEGSTIEAGIQAKTFVGAQYSTLMTAQAQVMSRA